MTAVQQSPHGNVRQNPQDVGSRSLAQIQTTSSETRQQGPPDIPNGTADEASSVMSFRERDTANDSFSLNGNVNGHGASRNGESSASMQNHAADGLNAEGVSDSGPVKDEAHNRPNARPVFRRSVSNHDNGVKNGQHEAAVIAADDSNHWDARHGYEEHYESEEYVAQLANVSTIWFRCV